ncbi:GAF domain-containing sensor histidine kinase [Streptomyces sp. NBC_00648]|uniref:sensor histidine kinase n=1 Tax=Streptomyces sp. NBC_00648 TaxID=2975797 RepID=UPI003249FF7B
MGGVGRDGARPLSRLRLDQLLDELQVRIDTVRNTRDRLHALLESVLEVGQELDLPQVLRRIVEAAVVLVDAEYGALGVIGQGRRLAQFLPVGIGDETQRRIGHLPSGHGLLGELIRHPVALRLAELSQHPASSGFPADHPPMHSFLGVPIRVGEEVFGNLYLTEKRGGAEFDEEDEAVLSMLAVAAGVAIQNARLYEEVRLRERWLEAGAEVTSALLSGVPESQVLEVLVERAREITSAELGVVDLVEAATGELQGALALGRGAAKHQGLALPVDGTLAGAAMSSGSAVVTADVRKDPRVTHGPDRWEGLGPAVAVPMSTRDGVRGVLLLARGAGQPPFSEAESKPLRGFADQAALALELSDRRRDAEQVSILEDRDRIARDLHDLAIQRLFATGMTLQSAQRFVQHPEAMERVGRAVDDLDTTIKIIRSTIFGLRAHDGPGTGPGLRIRMVRALEGVAPALGFTPALRMEGLIDVDVPGDVAEDVLAVLGESLTNVARHANATAAEVVLVVRGGEVALTVTDNGIGIPVGAGRRGGLRNLAERADGRGGTCVVDVAEGGGTRLEWRVPLGDRRPGVNGAGRPEGAGPR